MRTAFRRAVSLAAGVAFARSSLRATAQGSDRGPSPMPTGGIGHCGLRPSDGRPLALIPFRWLAVHQHAHAAAVHRWESRAPPESRGPRLIIGERLRN